MDFFFKFKILEINFSFMWPFSYDNSDADAALIITNFHLHLKQLWWQFFQNFVYGGLVYAQTWEVLTLKNCIEPP